MNENKFNEIKSIYNISDQDAVTEYLLEIDEENPQLLEKLLDVLIEMPNKLLEVFHEKLGTLTLEFFADAEANFSQLFVTVDSGLEPNNAIDLLDNIFDTWYMGLEPDLRQLVTVTI